MSRAIGDRAARLRTVAVSLPQQALLRDAAAVWLGPRIALISLTFFTVVLAAYWGHRGYVGWNQWDTHWYLQIARDGYFSERSANFFPLYPLLIAGLSFFLAGGHPATDALRLFSALAISNLSALVAVCGVAWLVRLEGGSRSTALAAIRLLVAYPLAFFLVAGYTEPVFLALAVLTFIAARKGAFAWAAIPAFAAALVRPSAVILVLPLAFELARQRGWRLPRTARGWGEVVVALAAVPAGLGCYMAFLWLRFGDPLLFLHTQQRYWHHELLPPWSTVRLIVEHLRGNGGLLPLDISLLLLFVAGTVLLARRLPVPYVLYMAGLLYLTIASPQPRDHDVIMSAGRYLTAGFPVLMLAGQLVAGRSWLEMPLLATGFMLQAALAFTFLMGGPIL